MIALVAAGMTGGTGPKKNPRLKPGARGLLC